MNDTKINLYTLAKNHRIITHKDYISIKNYDICDLDGVVLDFSPIEYEGKKVGYYIPEGYNSIKIYYNPKLGLNSQIKYFNKICFDIGFLNKDRDFNQIARYCKLAADYLFSKYKFDIKESKIKNIVSKGMDVFENEYVHYKPKKYYFTDKTLTGEERKYIALTNMNENRTKTNRFKVEGAIEYFIQGDEYISQDKLAKFLNTTIRTVKRNLTLEDKERIKGRNIELTGFPTHNEYMKSLHIDMVCDSYIKLKDLGRKTTVTNIANDTGIHRVTVSKILSKESLIKQL